jgi:hypothetical protein
MRKTNNAEYAEGAEKTHQLISNPSLHPVNRRYDAPAFDEQVDSATAV